MIPPTRGERSSTTTPAPSSRSLECERMRRARSAVDRAAMRCSPSGVRRAAGGVTVGLDPSRGRCAVVYDCRPEAGRSRDLPSRCSPSRCTGGRRARAHGRARRWPSRPGRGVRCPVPDRTTCPRAPKGESSRGAERGGARGRRSGGPPRPDGPDHATTARPRRQRPRDRGADPVEVVVQCLADRSPPCRPPRLTRPRTTGDRYLRPPNAARDRGVDELTRRRLPRQEPGDRSWPYFRSPRRSHQRRRRW